MILCQKSRWQKTWSHSIIIWAIATKGAQLCSVEAGCIKWSWCHFGSMFYVRISLFAHVAYYSAGMQGQPLQEQIRRSNKWTLLKLGRAGWRKDFLVRTSNIDHCGLTTMTTSEILMKWHNFLLLTAVKIDKVVLLACEGTIHDRTISSPQYIQ